MTGNEWKLRLCQLAIDDVQVGAADAKAALNMLTRTSAQEMLTDGILMTSVDTGWITDERPHPTKMRLADEGFHAPLDLVDGAARVYDPIVRGEQGEDLYGCFLKDYAPCAW